MSRLGTMTISTDARCRERWICKLSCTFSPFDQANQKSKMTVTAWPFIEFDASDVAYVAGTRTKVVEVALDHLAHAWDAEEIHRQYPTLSLPQIHASLGYYFENREACDRLIEQQLSDVAALRDRLESPALTAKLRAAKRGA
jgi:uncharacterized protein (DUF433 family)